MWHTILEVAIDGAGVAAFCVIAGIILFLKDWMDRGSH